jgi:gas vesicle protein
MEGRTTYANEMLCFLAGSAIGAAVALLWAPQSGRSTRQLVGRELRDTVASARDMKERATRAADDIRGEAGRRLDQAVSAVAGDAAPGTRGGTFSPRP